MKGRAAIYFPFGIACVLPPAGLLLGLLSLQDGERDTGIRVIVVSILAAAVWVVLLLSLQ